MEKSLEAKIAIISRSAWNDKVGTSSTETNLFKKFRRHQLVHVYIESEIPDTEVCDHFFQISELGLIKSIFNRKINIGTEFNSKESLTSNVNKGNVRLEKMLLKYVRNYRLFIFTILREIVWVFPRWKKSGVIDYLFSKNIDVLFCFGSPLIFLTRLQLFVVRKSRKPTIYYMLDDTFTHTAVEGQGYLRFLYRSVLSRYVGKLVESADSIFVVSEKMRDEVKERFDKNAEILTKSIDANNVGLPKEKVSHPIRILYLGQLLYGRDHTLNELAKVISEINSKGKVYELHTYTPTKVDLNKFGFINDGVNTFLYPAVPYEEIRLLMASADVLLFVESFENSSYQVARLSFSTKITDYLESNRTILAIGPAESAPIEYFASKEAAIVVTEIELIEKPLRQLCLSTELMRMYSSKALETGLKYHSDELMDTRIKKVISSLLN